MDTLIIHPENEAQQKALQLILDGFKIPYDNEPLIDATKYLTSTKANKQRLVDAMQADKNNEGTEIKLGDLWK